MKITRSLVLKLIILLIIVLGGFAIKKSYFKSQSDTFKTAKVERGTIEQVVSTSGKIKAKKEVELKFQISGTQFLIEAIVLAFFGGTIGIILGIGGSILIGRFFTTTITLWPIALAFGVSFLVGVIFGVAPAVRASRLNPIEALRYE